ncbi:TetR family transcriptional regulator [Mesorhizobium sp. CA8]|nr:TetR family transcriptional regulator [Mesorhizobium sp. CA8]MBZ9820559.1 TetR family transcriptional regulator [Mesorhizobium sp. CA4]
MPSSYLGPSSRLALEEASAQGRPPYRCDEQRVSILDATLLLVATVGCDTLRLRDVAASAGVSIGSVQHYFDTRENLLVEAFEDWRHRALIRFNPLLQAKGSGLARLRGILRYLKNEDPGPSTLVWISFCLAATRIEDVQVRVRDLFQTWHDGLSNALLTSGQWKDLGEAGARQAASLFMSLHFGAVLTSTITKGSEIDHQGSTVHSVLSKLLALSSQ